ncbi:hypothetical protein [Psychrobacter sp.]|uniref:hypothetical protein n=1 Tax=Psychrobacter sp. TaxID=56811 RepID=UPI003F99EFF3
MSKSTLALLDSSLYPQSWQQQSFSSPQAFFRGLLAGDIPPDADAFTKQLLVNDTYKDWIYSSVFGRYLHRNFTAFYRQTEESFNTDMPDIFRRELTRHAQYLPVEQVLFFAGDIPKNVRQTKLFTTTVNPATAMINAQRIKVKRNASQTVVNQIDITGKHVLGFPIRHNKRTSERLRNEVLILDFQNLRLVNELKIEDIKKSNIEDSILLRCYELR